MWCSVRPRKKAEQAQCNTNSSHKMTPNTEAQHLVRVHLGRARSECDVHSGGTKHDLEGSLILQLSPAAPQAP